MPNAVPSTIQKHPAVEYVKRAKEGWRPKGKWFVELKPGFEFTGVNHPATGSTVAYFDSVKDFFMADARPVGEKGDQEWLIIIEK